jgi:IS605 OrfB family transposase
VFRRGKFYLLATVEIPAAAPMAVTECLGVDLGVVHLASTSDGDTFTGDEVERVRARIHRTRRRIGTKMSHRETRRTRKNARRARKRIGTKEARFRKHVNHCIAKHLVARAKDTGRGIAVEELTGIRDSTRFRIRKGQRAKIGGWAFAQLRAFVTYKAQLSGVPVILVDPRNTSRTCARCGHCEKANRTSQSEFACRACGHTAHADLNAAQNIATRGAAVMQPEVSQRPQTSAA